MTLFSMVGTNFVSPTPINVEGLYGIVINYIWKIKVTQIDCGFNNPLRGMYFTANTKPRLAGNQIHFGGSRLGVVKALERLLGWI